MNDKIDPKVLKQKQWLEEIVGRIALSEKNQEDLENRSAGLKMIESLGAEKNTIREELLKIEVKVKDGPFGGKKMKILDPDGEYLNEVDTWHHGEMLAKNMTFEQAFVVQTQVEKVHKVEASLKGNPYYDPGAPDYGDLVLADLKGVPEPRLSELKIENAKKQAEYDKKVEAYEKRRAECEQHVAEDLWTPMVREGVIPENQVPKKYSEVDKLFANASAAYEERLQEYSASMSDKDLLNEKFKTGFKIGKAGLKLITAGVGLGDAVATMEGAQAAMEITEEILEVLEHIETAMTIAEEVTKAALTDRDFTTVGSMLAGALGDALTGGGVDPMVCKIVATCASNAVKAVSVGSQLKNGDLAGAMEAMVGAVADELAKYDPDKGGGLMTLIGEQLKKNVGRAIKAHEIVGLMTAKPPRSPLEILSALMDAAEDVATTAISGKAKADDEEEEEEDEDEDEDEEDTSGIDWAAAKEFTSKKFTQADLDKLREAAVESDEKAALKFAKSMEEQAEAERAQFEAHLRKGFPVPMSDDEEINLSELDRIQSIEYIIAIQKKNEAVLKMCETIAKKGVAVIAQLFPPAAIAQSTIALAFAIKDTIEKTQELIIWVENVEDAMNAKSAQVDAMLNRKGLQGKQTMRAAMQVAIEASRVVAAALAMTPVAGAAPVVKASADVAEAAIELADLIYTEVQLAKAWKIYVRARDNPEDRYLARKATRENPTLSKYAMAYGSLSGDPIAVEGMRRCGLDKQVLANPGTNVHKVVTYLEGKYPDDPVLLRSVPVKEKWHPGPVELTSASFMSFYRMATTKAVPLVATGADISGIAAAMGRLDEAEAAFAQELNRLEVEAKKLTIEAAKATPLEMDKSVMQMLSNTLQRLEGQLNGYKATTPDDKPHPEMEAYVSALAAKAKLRDIAVSKLADTKPWTALYKKAA